MLHCGCLVVVQLFVALCLKITAAQIDPYYTQQNVPYDTYNIPSPGERDYRTYTYNNRRYGQHLPNGYNGRRQPGDPNVAGQDVRFTYDAVIVVTLYCLLNCFYFLYYCS